jgi:hypothetical protein
MDGKNAMLLSGLATFSFGASPQAATGGGFLSTIERPRYKNVEPIQDSTTDSVYTATSLIKKSIADLDELSMLPVGWDSYDSPVISNDLIMSAKYFLHLLEDEFIAAPHVVPISGGGVQFELQNGDRELELEFIDSDNIAYLKVQNDEPIEENQFNRNDFRAGRNAIQWLKGF